MATSTDLWQREQDCLATLKTMSNWGRWGPDDELGSLNLVTPEVIRRAAAEVKTGRVYTLGEEIASDAPSWLRMSRPTHFMLNVRINESFGEPIQGATDGVLIPAIHGTVTHLDMFCHQGRQGSLYNGIPPEVVGVAGANRLGAEGVPGIVTRGVLLDIARLRGYAWLPADYLITADDLSDAAKAADVEIEAGDAVLIRTGWRNSYAVDPVAWGEVQPGIGPSAGLYLAEREACLVGADNIAVEAQNLLPDKSADPRVTNGVAARLHPRFLGDLGIYLLELLNLESLAADGVSTFQLALGGLRIKGATAAPVNPLAIC